MKLDLKQLSMRLSQAKDEPPVPTDGVNKYLLEKILLPCMSGTTILLRDIDYDIFDIEDVDLLEKYYNELSRAGGRLFQLMETMRNLSPQAQKTRRFC